MRTPTKNRNLINKRQRFLVALLGGSAIVGSVCWPISLLAGENDRPAMILKRSAVTLMASPATGVSTNPYVHSSDHGKSAGQRITSAGDTATINPFAIPALVEQTIGEETVFDADPRSGSTHGKSNESGRNVHSGLSRLPSIGKPRLMSPIARQQTIVIGQAVESPVRQNHLASPQARIADWEIVDSAPSTDMAKAMSGVDPITGDVISPVQSPDKAVPTEAVEQNESLDENEAADQFDSEVSFSLSDDSRWDHDLQDFDGPEPANEPANQSAASASVSTIADLVAADPISGEIAFDDQVDEQADGHTFHLDSATFDDEAFAGESPSSDLRSSELDASELGASEPGAGEFSTSVPSVVVTEVLPMFDAPVQPMVQPDVEPTPIGLADATEQIVDFDQLLRHYRFRPPVDVDHLPMSVPMQSHSPQHDSAIRIANNFTDTIRNEIESSDGVDPQIAAAMDGSDDGDLIGGQPIDTAMGDQTGGDQTGGDQTGTPGIVSTPAAAAPANPPRLKLPAGTPLVPLELNLASVRSLTLGGTLRNVHVVDDTVCQAIATSGNRVKLIGAGNGVTQMVVWAETVDSDGQTRPMLRAFEVRVDEHREAASADDSLVTLDQTIRQTFPTSNVQLDHYGDRLRISGQCDTEQDAKKILRIVRRTCLMPVDDHLQVR